MEKNMNVTSAKYELMRNTSKEMIPHLKISLLNNEGEVIKTGYLSPYRGICFQISANSRGDGDLASTFNMDLRQLCVGAAKPYDPSAIVLELIDLVISRFAGTDARVFNGANSSNMDTIFKFTRDSIDWIMCGTAEEAGIKNLYSWVESNVAYCDM